MSDIDDSSQINSDIAVARVRDWLARADNCDWLLIFDNVDHDYEQAGETRRYDIYQYFPGDHGSILVTTRRSHLAHLGQSRRLTKVDMKMSRLIFKKWYREPIGKSWPGLS
jgi:hypothetical protein